VPNEQSKRFLAQMESGDPNWDVAEEFRKLTQEERDEIVDYFIARDLRALTKKAEAG
jgi:hypothetical protein